MQPPPAAPPPPSPSAATLPEGEHDAPATPPPADALTFGPTPDATDTTQTSETLGVDVVVTAADADGAFHTSDVNVEWHEEYFTQTITPGEWPTLRLTFKEARKRAIHDGKEVTGPGPLAGKSYHVKVTDQRAIITYDDGGHVPREEGRLIAMRFVNSEARYHAFERFAKAPVRIGQRSDALEAALRVELSHGFDEATFDDVEAKLTGKRDVDGVPCGVFETRARGGAKFEGADIVTEVRGEVLVRTSDSRIARIALRGPVKMQGKLSGVAIRGEGTCALDRRLKAP